jgi:hypothetical protein
LALSTRFGLPDSGKNFSTVVFSLISIGFGLMITLQVVTFTLAGSVTPIKLTLSGHVIPPTFTADVTRLDYGRVAFGFFTTRNVTLTNTSEIPIRFLLRCPQNGKSHRPEVTL